MELKVKYSSRFKKGLRLAVKRGLDISLLENVVEKLKAGIAGYPAV
jgi:mRNA-degrading endonuclease YafQ of YafQ-DinJ toxin-antitoxin module